MKRLYLLLALSGAGPCLAQGAAPAPAPVAAATPEPDPRSLALATEIVDISFPSEGRNAMLLRRMDRMIAQLEAASGATTGEVRDAEAQEIYDRYATAMRREVARVLAERSPATFAAWARAYARAFTYAELVEIRAFAATPAGRNFLQRISEISADPEVIRTSTASMTAMLAAIQPLEEQLQRDVRAYAERRNRQRPH